MDQEITLDDLFDLGFEPLETESKMSMDYVHPETGIKIWKAITNPDPAFRFWKTGYGRDKKQFKTLDELKEYIQQVSDAK